MDIVDKFIIEHSKDFWTTTALSILFSKLFPQYRNNCHWMRKDNIQWYLNDKMIDEKDAKEQIHFLIENDFYKIILQSKIEQKRKDDILKELKQNGLFRIVLWKEIQASYYKEE